MKNHLLPRLAWPLLFVTVMSLFVVEIQRPIDLPSWHEFDDAAIARNYLREGFDFLHPRIDWRGDGPGYTEMEFPAFSWVIAIAYRLFGVHEITGRLLACAATLASFFVFHRLSRYLLPEGAAWAACVFFGMNRIVVFVASSIQAEAFMFLFYLLAVYHFLLWRDSKKKSHYWISLFATASALLCKEPSVHIGLLFLSLLVMQDGKAIFRSASVWLFGIASLIPALLWYSYAHSIWVTYQKSMGLSNEFHWIALDVFQSPKFVGGLIGLELLDVWMIGGVALAFLAVRCKTLVTRLSLLWLASIFLFYLFAIRTASAPWAWYYHIVSIPPAALLVGAGIEQLRQYNLQSSRIFGAVAVSIATISVAWHIGVRWMGSRFPQVARSQFDTESSWITGLIIAAVSLALVWCFLRFPSTLFATQKKPIDGVGWLSLSLGLVVAVVAGLHLLVGDWDRYAIRSGEYACAVQFSPKVPPYSLIVASGGICRDKLGHAVASDAPQMFYWLGKKGFSLCEGDQSLELVSAYRERGAAYFVAEKSAVGTRSGFESRLFQEFSMISECDSAWLFDLRRQHAALRSKGVQEVR